MGTYEAWPIPLYNLNLPRAERVKAENVIPVGLVPGPKGPVDIESFLRPLIDEFHVLGRGIAAVDAEELSKDRPLIKFRLQ